MSYEELNSIKLPDALKRIFIYSNDTKGNEKIVMGLSEKYHITLHWGTQSKVLDLHFKNQTNGEYFTVFRLRYFSAARLVVRFLQLLREDLSILMSRRYTINLGKLGKYKKVLIKVGGNIEDYRSFLKFSSKNKRIKLATKISPQGINNIHLEPPNVKVLEEVMYVVMSRDVKPEAIAVRNLFNPYSRKLHYIKFSDIKKILMREFETISGNEDNFFFDEKLFIEMFRKVEDDYKREFDQAN
ncbi:MAG: hypothetical protein AAF620_09900 [Bacteroidota bacterium]